MNNDIKTETGEPLDFKERRYLIDIYADRSDNLCSMKCAQIGFTTFEILATLHEAYYQNRDIIYVLPTADDVKSFSGGKTNRMIDNNPILQTWTADKDSIEQKRVGKATIYYKGSWTERTALMISASTLIVDEYDRCKASIVEQYDSRLQNAKHPKKAYFSNPSFPDIGIDKIYQQSDKKVWHVKHKCNQIFPMYENCINYSKEIYECPFCKEEITQKEINNGEWKATDLNKDTTKGDWSGYWIPLWINPMFTAQKIAQYKREKSPEYFANFVAGLPYVNSNDMLSQSILEKNLSSELNEQTGRVIIGLDTGHNLHYTMMNKQGIFYHGYCKSVEENKQSSEPIKDYDPYNEIEQLLKDYPRSILVADQGGDLIGVRRLQAKYVGRVFLVWFTKETKTKQLIRWGEGEEAGKVLADRNRVMQMIVDQLNEGILSFNGTVEEWQPFFNHALNIYRVRDITDENDPQYGWRWVWKRKGADHWFLSLVYAMIGMDKYGEDLATIIKRESPITIGSNQDGSMQGGGMLKYGRPL